MNTDRTTNILGALVLALADEVLVAVRVPDGPSEASSVAALALLGHAPGLSIKELGEVLGLSHPGTVRLVDRLSRDAWVVRGRSSDDGRAVTLNLTDEGRALVERMLDARRDVLAAALGTLGASERKSFARLTEKMLRGVLESGLHAARTCRLCDPGDCVDCPVESEMIEREGLG